MVPCTRTRAWSLYVWDMRDKVIHVLDPINVTFRRSAVGPSWSIP